MLGPVAPNRVAPLSSKNKLPFMILKPPEQTAENWVFLQKSAFFLQKNAFSYRFQQKNALSCRKMQFSRGTWQQTAGNRRRAFRARESRTLDNLHKTLNFLRSLAQSSQSCSSAAPRHLKTRSNRKASPGCPFSGSPTSTRPSSSQTSVTAPCPCLSLLLSKNHNV